MSNEKDVSKELADVTSKILSRRDAVKKAGSIAAGAALAFLGLGVPGVSQQKETLACCGIGGCSGTCSCGCYDGCNYTCLDTCGGGCTEWCGCSCSDACFWYASY
jgi:hypothetical protein